MISTMLGRSAARAARQRHQRRASSSSESQRRSFIGRLYFLQQDLGHDAVVVGQVDRFAFVLVAGALHGLADDRGARAARIQQHVVDVLGPLASAVPTVLAVGGVRVRDRRAESRSSRWSSSRV